MLSMWIPNVIPVLIPSYNYTLDLKIRIVANLLYNTMLRNCHQFQVIRNNKYETVHLQGRMLTSRFLDLFTGKFALVNRDESIFMEASF